MTYSLRSLIWLVIPFLLVACSSETQEPESQKVDYLSSVQQVGKLRLSEMTLTKVGRISDPSIQDARTLREKAEAAVDKMKIGTRIGVYSYQTYVAAYIDLNELTPSDLVVDSTAGGVAVNLPPVRIEWTGRDMGFEEVHYRVSGMRSDIGLRERAELKRRMAAELRKEVEGDRSLDSTLRESARAKATAYFTQLFNNWGLEPRITFRDK